MARRNGRRPKRKKVDVNADSEVERRQAVEVAEVVQDDDKIKQRKWKPNMRQYMEKGDGFKVTKDAETEERMPFCCAVCRCSEEQRSKIPEDDPYIWPGEGGLGHRRCCHGVVENDFYSLSEWAVPLHQVHQEALLNPEKVAEASDGLEWITQREITAAYQTAKRQESQLYNADGEVHPDNLLRTHEYYHEVIEKPFEALAQKKGKPGQCVVLDVFAGIGTGIVVLKRLGIDLGKVIHVEHDKVATNVYMHNHDRAYNPNLPDDGEIKHVYIDKFESLEANLENFFKEHGPIDIIIGGPPCVDFSAVNARREGVHGEQGQYMLRFGRLIRTIERLQQPHPVFFLAENVYLRGDDLEETRKAFGFDWNPINFDALYVSPTRRNRHFITNVPLKLADFDFQGPLSHIGPSSCLEQGFYVPAHLICGDTVAKAQCFMGSASRIDERNSLRMYVFNEKPVRDKNTGQIHWHGRPMKVFERELLMGYPKGYVEVPVSELFRELGGALGNHFENEQPWKETLRRELHHFAGNYHGLPCKDPYKFYAEKEKAKPIKYEYVEKVGKKEKTVEGAGDAADVSIGIKMAPHVANSSSQPTHFTSEEYAKHLIGMAYSVPVVELLLRPLQRVFGSRRYRNFEYQYQWEDEDSS